MAAVLSRSLHTTCDVYDIVSPPRLASPRLKPVDVVSDREKTDYKQQTPSDGGECVSTVHVAYRAGEPGGGTRRVLGSLPVCGESQSPGSDGHVALRCCSSSSSSQGVASRIAIVVVVAARLQQPCTTELPAVMGES